MCPGRSYLSRVPCTYFKYALLDIITVNISSTVIIITGIIIIIIIIGINIVVILIIIIIIIIVIIITIVTFRNNRFKNLVRVFGSP